MKKTMVAAMAAILAASLASAQQVYKDGQALTLCKLWDGADIIAIDASGNLTCNAGTGTFTVTGTVTANAGTNLNTSLLLTTTAHDAAFGVAGTADTQVRSIQGIASMTPVQVSQATGTNLHAVIDSGTVTTITNVVHVDDNASSLTVDNGGTFAVQAAGPVAHDAVGTATNPLLVGGYASAAAPTDVSADGDAVRAWRLRNGAAAVSLVSGGNILSFATDGIDFGLKVGFLASQQLNVGTIAGAITPGTAAGNLGKAEDAGHTTGDTGVFALGVRVDPTTTAITSANTDYSAIAVDHVGAVAVGVHPGRFSCFIQAATVTTVCQAAPAAGLRAYVTSFSCSNDAASVQTLDIVFGTGAACVTGIAALTHKYQMGTLATTTSPQEISAYFGDTTPLVPTAANAICVRPSAATAFGCTLTGFIAP